MFFLLVLVYYFRLNAALGFGMFITVGSILYLSFLYSVHESSGLIALAAFLAGWVFQFVGHYFEGRQPAFLTSFNTTINWPILFISKNLLCFRFIKRETKIILENRLTIKKEDPDTRVLVVNPE